MLKNLLCSSMLLISANLFAQNYFEIELDSIKNETEASEFIERYKSNKGKLITFNKEKHHTKLADDLFNLGTGGKKIYKTDVDRTYYKIIEKVEIPYHRVRYIFLDGNKSTEDIKALQSEIIKKHQEGYPFKALAKLYSMDVNANRGGDSGWFTKGDMNMEFENHIFNSSNNINTVFTIDIPSKDWCYIVLKTHETKLIEEIKVLKIIESIKR